jgi:hypothetical protein
LDRPEAHPTNLVRAAQSFGQEQDRQLRDWRSRLDRLLAEGAVAVWGAGAKGVTFCNLVDPEATRIACVVDVNPAKQGHFLVGAGHRIVAPEQLKKINASSVLVLNPNYTNEVAATLQQLNSPARVINLMHDWGNNRS